VGGVIQQVMSAWTTSAPGDGQNDLYQRRRWHHQSSWKAVQRVRAWPDCITLGFRSPTLSAAFVSIATLGADLLMADTPEGEDLRRFPGRAAILSLGGHVFDLCEHSTNAGEGFDPVRTGLDHFAFEAESLDDLRAWASWLDIWRCAIGDPESRRRPRNNVRLRRS
jgi:hypothetical protein